MADDAPGDAPLHDVLAALPERLRPAPVEGSDRATWTRTLRRLARRLGTVWGSLSLEEKRALYAVAVRILHRAPAARGRLGAPLLARLRPASLGLDAALLVVARAILARAGTEDPATRRALEADGGSPRPGPSDPPDPVA